MFVVTISGVENPKSHLRWESQIRTFRNSVVQSVGQRTETSRRLMLGKKQPQDKWGGAHGKGKGIRITRVQKMLLLLFLTFCSSCCCCCQSRLYLSSAFQKRFLDATTIHRGVGVGGIEGLLSIILSVKQ